MRKKELMNAITICILLLGLLGCSDKQQELLIEDMHGVLSETKAPVSVEVKLNKDQLAAAKEGRLGIYDQTDGSKTKNLIPTQPDGLREGTISHLVLMMPEGEPGLHSFKLVVNTTPFNEVMKATLDPNSGQVMIEEGGEKVLQYNYQTVYEKDVVRPGSEKDKELIFSNMSGVYYEAYLKAHPELERNNSTTSSIYSVPRSDYIHPLYGLEGEMLTNDWPDGGHPHHRGIFWAWPEVKYGNQLGDIYALQRVFARPTGKVNYTNGPEYAEVDAENLWMWEEKEAIVRENAVIRVYRSTPDSRIIDLTIKLIALKDSVTLATRFTDRYGGLNMRMQTPQAQEISYHTDAPDSNPLRAWSDFEGIFEGNESASGLMVLQHKDNPEYPGDWVEYPNLAWVQPTFPSPGTRYPLSKDESLVLRYRLIIHEGGKPSRDISEKRWDAYHAASTPQYYNDQPALNN